MPPRTRTIPGTSKPAPRGRNTALSAGDKHWEPARQIERILIPKRTLARRVRSLGAEIQKDFGGGDLVVVALLNGTVLFLADLIRELSTPLRLDFIGVSSYRGGTKSQEILFTKELRLDVRGRDVLLVDDILDTGRTLDRVLKKIRALKPRRVKVCVLLEKEGCRTERVAADYVGFKIPDLFVVGYGLDYAERFRNLPYVAVLGNESGPLTSS